MSRPPLMKTAKRCRRERVSDWGEFVPEYRVAAWLTHPLPMSTHDDNLAAVLREHELTAGMVVAADGATLSSVGDPSQAGCENLMSALVGPYGDARATFDSLEGQLLPRMWMQGGSFAFVDK